MRRGMYGKKEPGRNDFLRSTGRSYDSAGMFGKQGSRLPERGGRHSDKAAGHERGCFIYFVSDYGRDGVPADRRGGMITGIM